MCEGKKPAAPTDEDVEKAASEDGITVINCVQCPACGHLYSFTSREDEALVAPPCPSCHGG
ncbi:MAG: hypothetical protein LLF87_06130 [Eubacteriales bacterium]|nr:hypothetical protein [Eubacteriales bacterium]